MQDGFSYTAALPPPWARLKLFFLTSVFTNKLNGNVDSALKFTQNGTLNFKC